MSTTRYTFADCLECGAEARVVTEPAERYTSGMGGTFYPGSVEVLPSCDCIDSAADREAYEEHLVWRAA